MHTSTQITHSINVDICECFKKNFFKTKNKQTLALYRIQDTKFIIISCCHSKRLMRYSIVP